MQIHGRIRMRSRKMTNAEIEKAQQALQEWRRRRLDINMLRRVYQEKVLDWVVKSMEFEKEPMSMSRLKDILKKEKTASVS
jgi:hypothetical protein